MTILAIETVYRGYRFRSRLEARWAVFFDAAGIEWVYEPEGYTVNGTNYLPDFWLPKLNCFAEIKPTEEATEIIKRTLGALARGRDCRAVIMVGTPRDDNSQIYQFCGGKPDHPDFFPIDWIQCLFCHEITFEHGIWPCNCQANLLTCRAARSTQRIDFALEWAQQARFEHGEDPRPPRYETSISLKSQRVNVYVAGAVLRDIYEDTPLDQTGNPLPGYGDGKRVWKGTKIQDWRLQLGINVEDPGSSYSQTPKHLPLWGRFYYAGPTICEQHGVAEEGLAWKCIDEVRQADVLFAWIDSQDTRGTLVEIGAAFVLHKPIFIAFANKQLSYEFYFIKQLATIAIICEHAIKAWSLFRQWRDQIDYEC